MIPFHFDNHYSTQEQRVTVLHRVGGPVWDCPQESRYYYCWEVEISWVRIKDYPHLTDDFSRPPWKSLGGWTRHVTEASRAGTYLTCGPVVAREPRGQIPCKPRDRPHGAPWLKGSHGGQGLHTWGAGPMQPHGSVAAMVARAGHRWGVARVEHTVESGQRSRALWGRQGRDNQLCLTTAFLRVSLPGTYTHINWCIRM